MSRLGIINNVKAGRTRAGLARVRELIAACGADSREVGDLPSIVAAAREMLDGDVELLAVNGGDGTAQAVITELQRRGGDGPDLAILPGGTTNLTAHDLNGRLGIDTALRALQRQAQAAPGERRYTARPLLAVSMDGAATQYGFFLGAGAILAGMRHFREHVGARGLRDELAAGLSLLRGLAGVAGREHAWSDHHTEIETGHEAFEGEQNLVLATTLERLLLGLRPWWGPAGGAVHLTALGHRPRHFLRVLPAILRGRRHRRATPANGYRSADVDRLTLRAREGFALDGQIFSPAADAPVHVEATAPVKFLCLGP